MSDRTIDPERRESTAPTMVDDRGHRHAMPKVDWERAESLKPSRLQGRNLAILVNVVAGVGFILFGYDQGVMSGLLTLPSFEARFPQTAGGFAGSRSAVLQSFMVAIYQIGCMVGALLNLWVGDKLGRKPTIVWGGFGILAGTVLQAASVNYSMLCVARVFNGIFNGLLTSTVPAYQSECAKPHLRGKLVLISGSLITFGVMTSYWVDLGFFFTNGEISWRFPIALQSVFTIAMIACIWGFRVPESPRWLASKGRHEEALAVLAHLEGTTVHDKEIVKTWQGMVETLSKSAGEFSLGELSTGGPSQHLRRTILGVAAQCFQQIGGINLITYYLTSVLTDMGLDAKMSRIISGVNGTCYFGTSLFAILVIERAGRRPLMYWTALLQCGTMVLLAGLYNITENGNKAAQGISVLCLFLFNTWFSVGWLGMTWLYPAEVTPLRIRAPANALSTASNWLFNFFVVMATGPMFANIRWGTYAFFAAMNGLIIFPCVYIFFPETKKYSLEELDMIFAIGYAEGRNPVGVSRQGDLPEIGTDEADKYFTGKRFSQDEAPTKRRFSLGHSHSEREKNKDTVQHVE